MYQLFKLFWFLSQNICNSPSTVFYRILYSDGKDTTLKEVDTDVESYEPHWNNRFRRFSRRPRSGAQTSESQGEGDVATNSRPFRRRRRVSYCPYFGCIVRLLGNTF